MITFYFDINRQHLIQAPGNQQVISPLTWVYGDNYNLQVYIVAAAAYLPILSTDTLTAILWQSTTPPTVPPQQQLAAMGPSSIQQDVAGNSYFLFNMSLKTSQLAAIVQANFVPSTNTFFHLLLNETDTERFSQSADLQVTINPDPFLGSTGANPVPPGYPVNPASVFEYIAHKGVASGYAGLDTNALVPVANLPLATLPGTPGANYPVDGVTIGIVSQQLKVISAGGGGNMLQSQYDNGVIGGGAANLIIDKAANVMISGVKQAPGTAATFNVPATGNATLGQVVLGSDTRLALATATTPGVIQPDNLTLKQVTGLLKAATAIGGAVGSGSLGVVQPDNVTTKVDVNGVLTVPLATNAAPGIVQPDNSTVTITNGIISAGQIPINNARVRNLSNQNTSATAGTPTALNFSVADFQHGATWWTAANPSQLIVPVTAVYHIGANVMFNGSSAAYNRIFIAVGATITTATIIAEIYIWSGAAGSVTPAACIDTIYSLTAGQILQLGVQSAVASLAVEAVNSCPCFWAYRMG